jgi:response regulator RpfG family c-di-GMP phosphodiesterase
MNNQLKYIIVDDDPTNNMICKMTLKNTLGEVDMKIFTAPEEGLSFIKNNFNRDSEHTILFLDLNMPTLTGWQFLEQYEEFSAEVKMQINIYLLSSSIDKRDWDESKKNKYVKGFLVKPMYRETILSIAEKEFQSIG